jgi:hypothetical protein
VKGFQVVNVEDAYGMKRTGSTGASLPMRTKGGNADADADDADADADVAADDAAADAAADDDDGDDEMKSIASNKKAGCDAVHSAPTHTLCVLIAPPPPSTCILPSRV